MKNSYFQELDLDQYANDAEIKAAYERLVLKHHLDKSHEGIEKYRRVIDAYDHLNTPEKREQYLNELLLAQEQDFEQENYLEEETTSTPNKVNDNFDLETLQKQINQLSPAATLIALPPERPNWTQPRVAAESGILVATPPQLVRRCGRMEYRRNAKDISAGRAIINFTRKTPSITLDNSHPEHILAAVELCKALGSKSIMIPKNLPTATQAEFAKSCKAHGLTCSTYAVPSMRKIKELEERATAHQSPLSAQLRPPKS